MTSHYIATLTTTDDPYYPGHPGYYAECEDCGRLGQPTDDPRDAHRLGTFHLEAMAESERVLAEESHRLAQSYASRLALYREQLAEAQAEAATYYAERIETFEQMVVEYTHRAVVAALAAENILARA
jgi:hypothetical protein